MLGALIGDIVGSRFEWDNYKGKDFELFTKECRPTDDSMMTLALGEAICSAKEDYSDLSEKAVHYMQVMGRRYPDAGYGERFMTWLLLENPKPYGSYGNGSAMRVSGAGFAGKSLEEVKLIARKVTEVTHNHPEGMKGAEATAVAIYLARIGETIPEIRKYIEDHYYKMESSIDEIRKTYEYDVSCQGSVPQALLCFFESTSFEDAIRNAISLGGDSDTIGAICGGVAEAYYGIPEDIREKALTYLDDYQKKLLFDFEGKYER